jgi:hypothetical protein
MRKNFDNKDLFKLSIIDKYSNLFFHNKDNFIIIFQKEQFSN